MNAERFTSFREFFPYYLNEHSELRCRRLHFIGIIAALLCVVAAIVYQRGELFIVAFSCGYGFAFLGHIFYQRNRPTTFKQPLYSFMADWLMFWQLLTGKLRLF